MAGAITENELGIEARLASSLGNILRGEADLGLIIGVRRSHSVLRARLPFFSNVRCQATMSPHGSSVVQMLVSLRCHLGHQQELEPYRAWLSHDVEMRDASRSEMAIW
jgi:3'-phosphoadenosine 5'-phosphosulfate sulfotransferase (PAPS reductase)/FAD synthetase